MSNNSVNTDALSLSLLLAAYQFNDQALADTDGSVDPLFGYRAVECLFALTERAINDADVLPLETRQSLLNNIYTFNEALWPSDWLHTFDENDGAPRTTWPWLTEARRRRNAILDLRDELILQASDIWQNANSCPYRASTDKLLEFVAPLRELCSSSANHVDAIERLAERLAEAQISNYPEMKLLGMHLFASHYLVASRLIDEYTI